MTTLAELVEALAVQTVDKTRGRDEDGRYGPCLLQQLREARVASTGRGSGASAAAARVQLNLSAHLLWEDLTGQIASEFVQASDMRPSAAPEVNLTMWWGIFSAAEARGETTLLQHEIASERLEGWAQRIRDLLDPPRSASLRDVRCPQCGESRAIFRSGEVELEVESDALQVSFPVEDGIMVECASCWARWVGDVQVIHLGRLVGVELDVDKIRDARRPVEEISWDPGGRSEEQYDPLRPEHVALTGGGAA